MTVRQLDNLDTEPVIDSWTPINLNRLPETPPTQPDLGQTHLIYPGKRHVFSGPPESAKTLAAYCVLIQVVRTGGTGILIDFEMGAYDARQRLRELGATPTELERIHYLEPSEPATPDRVNLLVQLEPSLVVIDAAAGAYTLEGLDDNKRLEVERFANLYITTFWRHQIATILIDHVVKNAEYRGRFQIGSERKLGAADVHYGFDIIQPISRGSSGRYKILTHKDRAGYMRRGHLADIELDSNPDTHQIAWTFTEPIVTTDDKGHFRYTILMEKVSDQLVGIDEPLSKAEVKRRAGGNGDQCGKAIDTLIAEGHLEASEGPRGSRLVRLVKPYSRSTDPKENPENNPTHSPVPVLFSSCSGTGDQVTCSPVLTPLGGEQVEQPSTPPQNNPETPDLFQDSGWFTNDNSFVDSELAYLETLTPDDDQELY